MAEPRPERIPPSDIRHRPLLSAAVAFAVGIVVARALPFPLWWPLLVGVLCAAFVAGLGARLGGGLRTALVLVLVGAAGAANQTYRAGAAWTRAETSLARLLNEDATLCRITGTVDGEVTVARISPLIETGDDDLREASTIRVRTQQAEANGRIAKISGDVSIVVEGELKDIGHGDQVSAFGWVVPLRPDRATDRYAVSQGIVARMFVPTPAAVRVMQRDPGSFFRFLYAAKQSFRAQIDAYFAGDTAIVLKAVLLGDRERLGGRLRAIFNKSGTTHILAISGLHVGIVYAAIFWLCRMLLIQRWPRRVIVLSVVISYAVTTGLRPATIRAALMIILFEGADALKFKCDSVNTVAAAALVILAFAPHHLFEAGFQLTFVAVLGIIVFTRDISRLLRGRPDELRRLIEPELQSRLQRVAPRVRRVVAGAIGVCAAATLCVAPVQAYYFNIVTPVSILATALLVPIIAALISLGLVFLVLASLAPLVAPIAAGAVLLATIPFMSTVSLASRVPFGHVFVAPPPAGWVWACYGSLLVVAARRWLGLRGARAVLAPACVLCAYLVWRGFLSPGPELRVTFVDVQHGASVVITRGRQTVVYDCGSGTPISTYDVGRGPVALQLWRMGVKRIDLLLLSHTDADHVNGVLSLIDRFPAGMIVANKGFGKDKIGAVLSKEFAERGIPFSEVGAGDRLALPGIGIDVLWPPKTEAGWQLGAVNDRSLVVMVRADGRSLLLTADIECIGMGGVLATCGDVRADVLYVPHHGVYEPVLGEFVRAVEPDHAVISGERREPVDHEKVRRLFTGTWLYETHRDGTVHLRATEGGWRAELRR